MTTDINSNQEIDLKNLLFSILYKWRGILIVAVTCGILFAGFRITKGLLVMQNTEKASEIQSDYEENLQLYESNKLSYEREIENLLDTIDSMNGYMSSSVLMQLSPYDKPIAIADLYIKTDYEIMPEMTYQNDDYTGSLLKAYSSIIRQYEYLEEYSSNNHWDELIKIEEDFDNNMLHLEVTYLTTNEAHKILEEVLRNVDKNHNYLQRIIGTHETIITSQGTIREVDADLARKQNDNRSTLLTLQKNLADKKSAVENLKKPQNSALSKKSLLISSIKYGVLGGILGGFMSVFLICINFLLSDKLFSEKELKEHFNLKILGVFNREYKSKVLPQIDVWLNKLEGQDNLSTDTVYKIAALKIRNASINKRSLIVIGNAEKDEIYKISNYLKELIPELEFAYGGNVILDLMALQLLSEYDGVILVEKRGVSTGEKIEMELELINDAGCSTIGCIVF